MMRWNRRTPRNNPYRNTASSTAPILRTGLDLNHRLLVLQTGPPPTCLAALTFAWQWQLQRVRCSASTTSPNSTNVLCSGSVHSSRAVGEEADSPDSENVVCVNSFEGRIPRLREISSSNPGCREQYGSVSCSVDSVATSGSDVDRCADTIATTMLRQCCFACMPWHMHGEIHPSVCQQPLPPL